VFETFSFALLIVLWPLCFFLIGLILLQGGAGDLSSAFGGGGQLDSTLGVGAGRKMSKVTGWMVFVFLVIVAILAMPHATIGSTRAANDTLGGPGAVPSMSGDMPVMTGGAPATDAPSAPLVVPPEAAPEAAPVEGVAPEAVAPEPIEPAAEVPAAPEAPAAAEPAAEAPAAEVPAEPAAEPAPAAQPNSTIRIDD